LGTATKKYKLLKIEPKDIKFTRYSKRYYFLQQLSALQLLFLLLHDAPTKNASKINKNLNC